MNEEFENLSLDYINICVKEAMEANDNNLSKIQIAFVRKEACDKIINFAKENGTEFAIGFMKERLKLG